MQTTVDLADETNDVASAASISMSSSSGIATVTWSGSNFNVGDHVRISGAGSGQFNGLWIVKTVPSVNSFTFDLNPGSTNTSTTGTVTNYDNIPDSEWDDNDTEIAYTNELGEVLLKDEVDNNGGNPVHHPTAYRYDSMGRQTDMAEPSAL